MPDIDFQKIELNLIPKKGDEPVVFYASQYETARPFIAVLKWGDSEFAPGVDYHAEIDIRKNDDNIVVITNDVSIDNNEVSVILPVQAVTCIGKNLGQVKIYAADDKLIAALNFILEVQPDPLANGVQSETAIDNLTQQIKDIAQEVIGEDYYNKTKTDALLADKADKSELPDMSNYYTKEQTYSSSQIDTVLSYKADRSELTDYALKDWVELNFVDAAYLSTHYYNKNQVDELIDNIFPTLSATGAVASFTTALNKHLVSVSHDAGANTIKRCGVNLWDEEWEVGSLNYTNGNNQGDANNIRSKNFIPVVPNSTFYIKAPTGQPVIVCSYDINETFIECAMYSNANATFNTITNVAFVRFCTIGSPNYGATYNNDISINYPSSDTEYHAYNGQTVPVADATTLTTLSGVNNVFADSGDVTVQYKYMSM